MNLHSPFCTVSDCIQGRNVQVTLYKNKARSMRRTLIWLNPSDGLYACILERLPDLDHVLYNQDSTDAHGPVPAERDSSRRTWNRAPFL